ncbi:MAG: hypothetical protein K5930_01605 [Treponemataceae bacterium]|nr:hypothetical protein [Treponemataceae bacterium]
MQYNYSPGRLRFRDPILRDGDIRKAAVEVVKKICSIAEISYRESTSSILVLYPEDAVSPEALKPLLPCLLKLEPKLRFYTPRKKEEILDQIREIGLAVERIKK